MNNKENENEIKTPGQLDPSIEPDHILEGKPDRRKEDIRKDNEKKK